MWQFCTRKLWNCPMLWLWSGSGRQYRSREIARRNQTGEPSATGLERRKNPNKTSYPEIHQQGAELCLALKDTLLSYLIWKSAWELEGGWAAYLWGEGFATVWILFHYPREDKLRGQRGEEKRTSLQFHAAGGWIEKESGWPLEMIRKSQCTPYMGAVWDPSCFHKTG